MFSLSVIIPLYNEECCLRKNFETVKVYLDTLKKDYEIILVNDGSTDSTGSLIEQIIQGGSQTRVLNSPKNKGKGHAVKTGILSATGQYSVFTDADLAVPARFIGECIKELEKGAPVVFGSRHLPDSSFKVREGPVRQLLGDVFRRFAQKSLGLRVTDITCGLKAFEKQAALDVFSRSQINGWGYDAEIIFLSQKLGYNVKEVPVEWYHSFDSKVKVGSACVKTLFEIFQVYYYYYTNRYHL